MSPPIFNPDGSEVSEIVLPDGSTASQVIGPDGNVVFEDRPDIPDSVDSYEDGDLSEYNTDASIGSTAFDGSNSLRLDNNTETYAYSGSGLDRYPKRGDTWEFYYYFTSNSFANFSCQWALQSVLNSITQGSGTYNGYGIEWSGSNPTSVNIYEDGNSQNTGSVSVSTGNWYRNEIRFNDPIEYEIFNPNDNSLLSLSFSSTTYDSGAFGFSSSQNATADRFIDHIRIIG